MSFDKGQQPEQDFELLRVLQWQAMVSDVITYNALISARHPGSTPC